MCWTIIPRFKKMCRTIIPRNPRKRNIAKEANEYPKITSSPRKSSEIKQNN